MATSAAQVFVSENRFYGRAAIALAALILVGFAVFDLLAGLNPMTLPAVVHVHAATMVAWIALFVVQSLLGAGRNLPLHRKLGWIGAGLVLVVVGTGIAVGHASVAGGRVAPIFTQPYFLALITLQPVLFGAMVFAAIVYRKRTDWHRRLMLGALIVILEPVLGRLTMLGSVIAMGGDFEAVTAFYSARQWLAPVIEMGLQLAVVAGVMLRDRAIRGSVHPALWWTAAAVLALYAGDFALAAFGPFQDYTASIAAG